MSTKKTVGALVALVLVGYVAHSRWRTPDDTVELPPE